MERGIKLGVLIKFKVFDRKNKVMHDVLCIDFDNNFVFVENKEDENWSKLLLEDCYLLQYSGLKDKKRTKEYPEGQEIYEGDIVTVDEFNPSTYTIEYVEGGFCLRKDDIYSIDITMVYTTKGCLCNVIGNSYENKELR